MNGAVAQDRSAMDAVPAWRPPLGRLALERVLRKVREWEPVDWDDVFEDLAYVLGDDVGHHANAAVPGQERVKALAQRFRAALMQLVNRARHDEVHERHPSIAELMDQASEVRSVDVPDDPWQAFGLVRRLGWFTLELVERLEEVGCIQDVVEC